MEELRGKTLIELEAFVQRAGFQGYRARQIHQWLYRRDARSFDEMSNIPADLRSWLASQYQIGGVKIEEILRDADGAQKILFGLNDGLRVEGVLMPKEHRWTLCISSQAGCSLDCRFCLTGKIKLRRNLTAAEIIDQVQSVRREILKNHPITNLVFMGMGEPLLNMDNLVPALRLLTAPDAVGIPTRRITVSTAGIIPGIRALAAARTGVNLAVSLGAPNDKTRSALMPINKKYPLAELIKACREFPLENRRHITFEYTLLKDVNDSEEDLRRLIQLVSAIRCKINLLCFNEDDRLPFKASPPETVERFRSHLDAKGFNVAVRYSMGRGIKGACGQLAANYL